MADQDIPNLDKSIALLPADFRKDIATRCSNDLYVFNKSVMGFKDMTEHAHGPTCVFLDQNPAQFKAVAQPRDTFKTSIATIGRTMQRVTQNPNRTHLIRNEKGGNAAKFLGAIAEHAERNRIFRTLYSSIIPKDFRKVRWNNEELEFNREDIRPEATITSLGMTASVTSQHYDDITYDDLISEEAIQSEKVMQETTERALRYRPLMRHPDEHHPQRSTLTLVFTRWAFHDTYSVFFKRVPRMAKLIRGAIENDVPMFPEHLSLETLAEIRGEIKEYLFSCLYMNNPRNAEVQDFNTGDLKFFKWLNETTIILYDQNYVEVNRWHLDQLDISATVDLAAAEKTTSDRNAVSVVGISPLGEAISLESWAKRCTPLELIAQMCYFQRRYRCRVWGIENVAYQAAFKHFLEEHANRIGLYFNVRPIGAIGKKAVRIRGLQPVLATGRFFIDPTQHVLRNEMSEFPLGQHDDALDALSMQLQLWTGQMSPERWARYKESERKVLGEIDRDNRLLSGTRHDEDESDLRPSEGITEYSIV